MGSRKRKKQKIHDITLVAADLKVPAKTKKKRPSRPAKPRSKKPPLPGGASFPSFQLPSPKSPTFYDDSVRAIANLRNLCKQCIGYVSRADQLFDGLHGVGSQLHQAGVLPKIAGGKFKDLTSNEWTAVLMALLNSPLSGFLLGGGAPEETKNEKGDGSD
ncbi:hypothetical protein OS242_06780 [Tumebacillus sp. DT12]|uniref:Uncharacterized protein n=1 Tax=Tumebacillus lacus TaxID=2995335 RepID=A0ABT3WYB5_9BACL|nr:hypothetical protein [Tumebacillus lacus]MCX7569664.1 hypothetical protein [Tumebacillus lacus]